MASCSPILAPQFRAVTWVGWMPHFLTSMEASAKAAGWITSVTLWTGMPSVILLSRLSARLHTRTPFLWVPSILLMLLSLLLLVIRPSIAWLVMLLAGAATSIRFNTILAPPVEMVSAEQSGSASGIVMSVGYMGALAAPLLAGFILDSGWSYSWVFVSLGAASTVTAAIALAVPETGERLPGT